jgi:hypothetical protein
MLDDGKYIFRLGKVGDRVASGWANPDDVPTFVLEYDGKQIGAAHGSNCFIMLIEVFDENKGHGTKFIELWERYAHTIGCTELEVSPVSNEKLEHILEKKRGFSLKEVDEYNEKTYLKFL